MNESIRIEALDENFNHVGFYDSFQQCARKLFIRNTSNICKYLNGRKGSTFTRDKRGVKSYKDGKKYHFRKINN